MKKYVFLLVTPLLLTVVASAQKDSLSAVDYSAVFERITGQLTHYRPDTTTAPNDKTTRRIQELFTLRGGFNIQEAVGFMIEEERRKGEKPIAQLDQLSAFFTLGNGGRWLNNAAIWIYRNHFTPKELKQLVKFYKTSAGKKMADDFPVIVLKSLAAAEAIKKGFEAGNQ